MSRPRPTVLPSRRAPRLAVVLACLLLAGCRPVSTHTSLAVDEATTAPASSDARSPGPERSPAAIRDEAAIQELLDRAAAAFLAADGEAVAAVLADPGSAFGQRWRQRAENLAGVPLQAYRLRVDASLPDLATERLRRRYADPVQVVYVVEEHALTGYDAAGPAADDLFLTVLETAAGWRVAGDRDAEPLGLVSADHLWDHGPVTATARDGILALHHPTTGDVEALITEALTALGQARQRWPLPFAPRVPILVPRDEEELSELLHATFDLTNFLAFATASPVSEPGGYELRGSRIVLNPDRFLSRSSLTRQRVLVHELVHVATRPVAGPMMPAWLEEGVAQALGEERSTTGTRLLAQLDASQLHLPDAGDFTVGGRDRIFLSYQLAWSFVEHLRRRFGAESVARFYAAVGAGGIDTAGTQHWHLDRAAREVLGAPFAELVERWQASR